MNWNDLARSLAAISAEERTAPVRIVLPDGTVHLAESIETGEEGEGVYIRARASFDQNQETRL